MKKKIFLLFILILIIGFSCERDDICAAETPTTPQLILRFYNLAEPDETKDVPDLYAFGLDDDDNPIIFQGATISDTDSIAIPLRTDNNQTKFVLLRNAFVDDNGTPDDTSDDFIDGENPDTITVNYVTEEVYVSRACGFKTIFNELLFGSAIDIDNWVINSSVVNNEVSNENQAHVQVFH